jgi:hypothetical protein
MPPGPVVERERKTDRDRMNKEKTRPVLQELGQNKI